MATDQRHIAGSVVRGYVTWIERQGLREAVRALVPAETQALLDHPPHPLRFVPSAHADPMAEVLVHLRGPGILRQVGYETTRDSFGPLLLPLIRSTLALFGATPRSVFANSSTLFGTIIRGCRFSWVPQGEDAGLLRVRHDDVATPGLSEQMAGGFQYLCELAGATGTVEVRLTGDGHGADYLVSWTMKTKRLPGLA